MPFSGGLAEQPRIFLAHMEAVRRVWLAVWWKPRNNQPTTPEEDRMMEEILSDGQ